MRALRRRLGSRLDAGRQGAPADEGRVALLALGFVVVAVSLVLVVVAATSVHLDRKRLLALADLAALDAADAVAAETYYGGGLPADGVPLRDADVRAAVDLYLRQHPAVGGHLDAVTVQVARTPDGSTVDVVLVARSRLPFLGALLPVRASGVTVEAWSSARAS